MTKDIATRNESGLQARSLFSDINSFENGQRMAKMLAASDLVPQQYRGNLANTVIALELAQRMGASPLAVMQATYIVHGKPGWSASFIIGSLNAAGKFSPIRFEITGEGDERTCSAWAYDLANNEKLTGPPVSIGMAKNEGWYQKKGSKWQTMPDLMLRYRAATFFGRLYAPEILMGMRTAEEIQDVGGSKSSNKGAGETTKETLKDLNERISKNDEVIDATTGEVTPSREENTASNDVEKQEHDQQPADNEPEKKNVRTRPAVIDKFKEEIDAIDTAEKVDTWRMKHRNRVIRELPKEADQDVVFMYAEQLYQKLLNQEKEPQQSLFISCPDEANGNVPVEYCDSCKSREGCPAHETVSA